MWVFTFCLTKFEVEEMSSKATAFGATVSPAAPPVKTRRIELHGRWRRLDVGFPLSAEQRRVGSVTLSWPAEAETQPTWLLVWPGVPDDDLAPTHGADVMASFSGLSKRAYIIYRWKADGLPPGEEPAESGEESIDEER